MCRRKKIKKAKMFLGRLLAYLPMPNLNPYNKQFDQRNYESIYVCLRNKINKLLYKISRICAK